MLPKPIAVAWYSSNDVGIPSISGAARRKGEASPHGWTSKNTARPMIQDFQQLTARRIEGQCIYRTTNTFAYKKYCRVRLVLFAGATPANLQQQHTHIVLRWPAASLFVAVSGHDTYPHNPQTRALSFNTPQLLSPLYLHSTPWIRMPESTPTRTPIHRSSGRQRCAVGRRRSPGNLEIPGRTYADGSPPKGRGQTQIINSRSALGKLTH